MNKNLTQEIISEIKKTEKLIKEEKEYIHFLLNELKDKSSTKKILSLLKNDKSLSHELIKISFFKFLFLFLAISCFAFLIFYLFSQGIVNTKNLNYDLIFLSFIFCLIAFICLKKMIYYEELYQKQSIEKRSIEMIIKLIEANEENIEKDDFSDKILNDILEIYIKKLKGDF